MIVSCILMKNLTPVRIQITTRSELKSYTLAPFIPERIQNRVYKWISDVYRIPGSINDIPNLRELNAGKSRLTEICFNLNLAILPGKCLVFQSDE